MQIIPPEFSVYPLEEANRIYVELSQSRINGRAVFRISPETFTGDDAEEESNATTPLTTRAGNGSQAVTHDHDPLIHTKNDP